MGNSSSVSKSSLAQFLPASWQKYPVNSPNYGLKWRFGYWPTRWAYVPAALGLGLYIGLRYRWIPLQGEQLMEDARKTPPLELPNAPPEGRVPGADKNRMAVKAFEAYDGSLDPVLNPYMRKDAFPHILPTWLIGARNALGPEHRDVAKLVQLLRDRPGELPAQYYNVQDKITRSEDDIWNELPIEFSTARWYLHPPSHKPHPSDWLTIEELRSI